MNRMAVWRVVCLASVCGLLGQWWGVVAATSAPHAPAAPVACDAADAAVPWRQVAPSVWVWSPPQVADVEAANAGFVMPVSALVDGQRAWVIDPGPSYLHGRRVRSSLRCHTGAEVVGVVNTHAHSENVLGNAAFADGTAIYALKETAEAMAVRCPQCLESLTARVGADAMASTRIVLPTHSLTPGVDLVWGRYRLQVLPAEQGHTDGDLLLWWPEHAWLWAGGLVYEGRVPELAQGSLAGWLAALDRLTALQPRGVVSATVSVAGPATPVPAALQATRGYLRALRDTVWAAMDAGASPHDTALLALPAYAQWAGYAERHGFNAQRAWRELEPAWMDRATSATCASPASRLPTVHSK